MRYMRSENPHKQFPEVPMHFMRYLKNTVTVVQRMENVHA